MKLNGYGTKNKDFRADVARKDFGAFDAWITTKTEPQTRYTVFSDNNSRLIVEDGEGRTKTIQFADITKMTNISTGQSMIDELGNFDSARKDSERDMVLAFRKATEAIMNLEQYATGSVLNEIYSITDKLGSLRRAIQG